MFIGAALAAIFYLAIRGGFLAAHADTADVGPYWTAALAGLDGLLSKQATDKLDEAPRSRLAGSAGGENDAEVRGCCAAL